MKNKHIKNLSTVLCTSLGVFLVIGLSGCSNSKACSEISEQQLDECKSSSRSSGFFAPVSSYSSHGG